MCPHQAFTNTLHWVLKNLDTCFQMSGQIVPRIKRSDREARKCESKAPSAKFKMVITRNLKA